MTAPFSIGREYPRKAWDTVIGSIEGAESELAELSKDFIDAMEHGHAFSNLNRKAQRMLSDVAWEWPWLDYAIGEFTSAKLWPETWPDFQPDPEEFDEYSRRELLAFRNGARAALIVSTAMMAATLYRDADRIWRTEDTFDLVSCGDPAEDWYAERFREQLLSGDLSAVPPFFPGDRTGIRPTRFRCPSAI